LPEILKLALRPLYEFPVRMNSFDYFKHPVSCLLYARPCRGEVELRQLQWTLAQIFPKTENFSPTVQKNLSGSDFDDDSLADAMWGQKYTPHLCLGQWRAESDLLSVKSRLEHEWSPVEWHVDRIYLVDSNSDSTSAVRFSVPLGGDVGEPSGGGAEREAQGGYRISRWQRRSFVAWRDLDPDPAGSPAPPSRLSRPVASEQAAQARDSDRLVRPDRARLARLARMLGSATRLRSTAGDPGPIRVCSKLCWLRNASQHPAPPTDPSPPGQAQEPAQRRWGAAEPEWQEPRQARVPSRRAGLDPPLEVRPGRARACLARAAGDSKAQRAGRARLATRQPLRWNPA
jgi:hypothetical protein